MANDLNQCNFIGRLGADPETRYLPSGDAVCNFRIAVGWKTKDKEGTEWIRVSTFGKLAEICGQYLKKGSRVFVSGSFTTREWEKEGQKQYSTEIRAHQVQMLDSRQDGDSQAPSNTRPPAKKAPAGGGFGDMDDDVPFDRLARGIGGHAI